MFRKVLAITDVVIADIAYEGDYDAADDDFNTVTLKQGDWVEARISSIKLTSGTLLAYV